MATKSRATARNPQFRWTWNYYTHMEMRTANCKCFYTRIQFHHQDSKIYLNIVAFSAPWHHSWLIFEIIVVQDKYANFIHDIKIGFKNRIFTFCLLFSLQWKNVLYVILSALLVLYQHVLHGNISCRDMTRAFHSSYVNWIVVSFACFLFVSFLWFFFSFSTRRLIS